MNERPEQLNIVLEQNIDKLRAHRQHHARKRSFSDRTADLIAAFAGSLSFVTIHLVVVAVWIVINAGLTPLQRFDPTFVILASAASVEAIFLSTFILISQNRMSREADERADLGLQIGLLAEHEITRLLQLTTALAQKFGIDSADDPHLDELQRDVSPEIVVDKINEAKDRG